MLSDILPTGFECGVLNGQAKPDDTVAIAGGGPIGLAALPTAQFYSPKNYYQRVTRPLREYRPLHLGKFHLQPGYVGALFKSILFLGIIGRERFHYWKLFFWSLSRRPRLFPLAITYAIYGFHFRKVAEKYRGSGMF